MFFTPEIARTLRARYTQRKLKREELDEEDFRKDFSAIKGIVLWDTLRKAEKCMADIENLHTSRAILKTEAVGLENLNQVLAEAMQKSKKPQKEKPAPNKNSGYCFEKTSSKAGNPSKTACI